MAVYRAMSCCNCLASAKSSSDSMNTSLADSSGMFSSLRLLHESRDAICLGVLPRLWKYSFSVAHSCFLQNSKRKCSLRSCPKMGARCSGRSLADSSDLVETEDGDCGLGSGELFYAAFHLRNLIRPWQHILPAPLPRAQML